MRTLPRVFLIGLIFLTASNPSSLFAIEDCNVEFCRLVNNYENGFGAEGVDKIVVTCIQGPDGATVSNQMNGEYIVSGTYKLGTFDTATIRLSWGGTTSYSVYEKYDINSAGEGSFTVRVIKTSGGSENLFLRMVNEWRWMFDVVPVNTICPGLEAAFTATITSGIAPLTVIFTDQSTGTIFSWEWDFGDGTFSTEQNPSHTYNAPGEYAVSLTVTGPEGSDTVTETNYITVKEARAMPWIPLLLLED